MDQDKTGLLSNKAWPNLKEKKITHAHTHAHARVHTHTWSQVSYIAFVSDSQSISPILLDMLDKLVIY